MRISMFFVVVLIVFCSCKKTVVEEQSLPNKNLICRNPFNPTLKKEILKMIKELKKEGKINEDRILSVVAISDFNNDQECVVIIKSSLRVDPNKLTGYTFVNNELVACYLLSDFCGLNLINKNDLIEFKDSISGYPNAFKSYPGMIYDAPSKTFKVINTDSLLLVDFEFVE